MPYKHNKLKGIRKTLQNDTKVICSSSLAIIWRLLLSRQSCILPVYWLIEPSKKSIKVRKLVTIEKSESFEECFVLTF